MNSNRLHNIRNESKLVKRTERNSLGKIEMKLSEKECNGRNETRYANINSMDHDQMPTY